MRATKIRNCAPFVHGAIRRGGGEHACFGREKEPRFIIPLKRSKSVAGRKLPPGRIRRSPWFVARHTANFSANCAIMRLHASCFSIPSKVFSRIGRWDIAARGFNSFSIIREVVNLKLIALHTCEVFERCESRLCVYGVNFKSYRAFKLFLSRREGKNNWIEFKWFRDKILRRFLSSLYLEVSFANSARFNI